LDIAGLAVLSGPWYLRGGLAGIYAVALAYPVAFVALWRFADPDGWKWRILLAVILVLSAPVPWGILISKGILAIVLLFYYLPFKKRGVGCENMGSKPRVFDRHSWVLALAPMLTADRQNLFRL
jgi:uncharacterized membrane protein YhaH (DUF805 family)